MDNDVKRNESCRTVPVLFYSHVESVDIQLSPDYCCHHVTYVDVKLVVILAERSGQLYNSN